MINEKKQLLFGFHVPSNNRYISLHIFCVLSESDATFNVGPLSIGPGLLERLMIFFSPEILFISSYQMSPFIVIRRDSTAVVRDTELCRTDFLAGLLS